MAYRQEGQIQTEFYLYGIFSQYAYTPYPDEEQKTLPIDLYHGLTPSKTSSKPHAATSGAGEKIGRVKAKNSWVELKTVN